MTESKKATRGGARPGAGRKPSNTPKKRQVPTKISVTALDKLDYLSKTSGWPKSRVLEYALDEIDEIPLELHLPKD